MTVHSDRGPTLAEAAAWIARFGGKPVVVKLGGELLEPAVIGRIALQLAVLHRVGLRPIVVHGGGAQVDRACRDRGVAIEKVGGRRITSDAVLELLVDVVAGDLNRRVVAALQTAGVPAHGFAAGVSTAIRCDRRPPSPGADGKQYDWGRVGDVRVVTPADFESLTDPLDEAEDPATRSPLGQRWSIPVLPSLGADADGWLNVNADAVARAVAVEVGAAKLVLLTGVRGIVHSAGDAGPISRLTRAQIQGLIADGVVAGGMRAKVEEALRALDAGIPRVHILSGRDPMSLLRELFTDDGCGTLLLP